MSNVKMMSTAMRTAAKAAAVAAFGAFALGPAMASVASAAPAAQVTAPLHMGEAGSSGSGDSDSHGHNSNQLPEVGRQLPKAHTSNDHVEVHILPSRD